MSLSILVDMNLSPDWVEYFAECGLTATHWSQVGVPVAPDRTIMQWARENGFLVFTHDLDFGTLLALSHASGPSVVQLRSRETLPSRIGNKVVSAINQHENELATGALVVIETDRLRVRVLPL